MTENKPPGFFDTYGRSVRLQLFDADGMALREYAEVNLNLFVEVDRIHRTRNLRVIKHDETEESTIDKSKLTPLKMISGGDLAILRERVRNPNTSRQDILRWLDSLETEVWPIEKPKDEDADLHDHS